MKIDFLAMLLVLFGFMSSCTTDKDNSRSLFGASYGINNATLIVRDLDSARNYYTDVLGFDMPKADDFGKGAFEGTLSAAVYLSDLASIELLGIKDTAVVSANHSFITSFLEHDEGLRLYALSTSSADTTHQWLTAQGFKMDSLQSGRSTAEAPKGWSWDDGSPEWRSVNFSNKNPSAHLPGFLEFIDFSYKEFEDEWKPYIWRKWYNHPNGVVGIAALKVVVDNLETARTEFKRMGLQELAATDSLVRFKIAHRQELHVITPKAPDDALSNFLKTRGQGVFALCFEVKNLTETREFLKKKLPAEALLIDTLAQQLTVLKEHAYGVQLEFIEEPKEEGDLARIYNFEKGKKLDTASLRYASALYTKYCALCHGNDRQGYAADHAPSLRSHSLMATTQSSSNPNYLLYTVSYGRPNTAMAGYAKRQGGPLYRDDIELLLQWLYELSGVEKPIELSTESIAGDIALGKTLYDKNCATCHGANGEGVTAPALGNPMLLATASDAYIRYAISEGRDSTAMQPFKDKLSKIEIDALTAYIRSRASGWSAPEAVHIKEPLPGDYVLNPHHRTPKFSLKDGTYVSAEQVLQALKDSSRIIILDARSKTAWYQTHIPGAISVPYYDEPDTFIKDIPNDSTFVVAYCACPHAASERVVKTLRRFGYKNTAILDEGILVWAQRGYPVVYGQDNKAPDSKKKK